MAKEKPPLEGELAPAPPIEFDEVEFIREEDKKRQEEEAKKKEEKPAPPEPPALPPDRSSEIVEGIAKLVERLPAKEAATLPQQAPGESDQAFAKRFSEEFFKDEGKMFGSLTEAVQRIVAPMLAQASDTSFATAEKLLAIDPETAPVWKKYQSEIKEYLRTQVPPSLQRNPKALDYAYKQVFARHLEEIAEDKAKAILEEERKKAPPAAPREPFRMEEGGTKPPGTTTPRRQVVITQEDERIADERGVTPDVVAVRRRR